MHEVHTRIRLGAPFTSARTSCRFTFQRRLVTLWAWLIRFPNWGPRPQISHILAMTPQTPIAVLLSIVYHVSWPRAMMTAADGWPLTARPVRGAWAQFPQQDTARHGRTARVEDTIQYQRG